MKIVTDSGYNGAALGRCYYVTQRVVGFSEDTTGEEIKAFVDVEKKAWYGQEFSARVEGKVVHIRRGVDSGD